jgi:hypothetical protein
MEKPKDSVERLRSWEQHVLRFSRAPTAFATITIFLALGQSEGPGAAGFIAAATGGFTTAYKAASHLTAGAAVLAAKLPTHSPPGLKAFCARCINVENSRP